MINDNTEAKSEIVSEVLQQLFGLLSQYASEQVGVQEIMSASEDQIGDANRKFLNDSDDLRADIISRQRVLNAISEIVSKIDDAFPEETLTMDFSSLSAKCTAAGADELQAKALIDDFWEKTE